MASASRLSKSWALVKPSSVSSVDIAAAQPANDGKLVFGWRPAAVARLTDDDSTATHATVRSPEPLLVVRQSTGNPRSNSGPTHRDNERSPDDQH